MIHAPRTYSVFLVAMLAVVLAFSQVTFTAGHGGATGPIPNRITQAIDDSQTVQLARNTHPQATKENDRGQVSDSFYADHMLLVLQRSPAQERKLERFIDSLNDRKSPNFHHWMTPEQFGKYGVGAARYRCARRLARVARIRDQPGLSQSDDDRFLRHCGINPGGLSYRDPSARSEW